MPGLRGCRPLVLSGQADIGYKGGKKSRNEGPADKDTIKHNCSRLGELINNSEDDSITIWWGKTGDEAQGGDTGWCRTGRGCSRLTGSMAFALGANLPLWGDNLPSVLVHGCPPKRLTQESQGVCHKEAVRTTDRMGTWDCFTVSSMAQETIFGLSRGMGGRASGLVFWGEKVSAHVACRVDVLQVLEVSS